MIRLIHHPPFSCGKFALRRNSLGSHALSTSACISVRIKEGLDDPFPPKYDCKAVEAGWSEYWDHWRLEAKKQRGSKARFSMILPPPNVTGHLHLGHALTVAIQDVLVKWHRMGGFDTSWLPGFDHAGLATQVVVEKRLMSQKGLSRHDLGREAFIKEINIWKETKQARMENQLKMMGSSLDWENEYYTLDEDVSDFVRKAFIYLFDAGMIYRGERIINWCPSLRSTISEVEVNRVELDGKGPAFKMPGDTEALTMGWLTTYAYEMENPNDGRIEVATTRPETMFGDVALAVHPKDTRHAALIGKRAKHPFIDRFLPIIADGSVEPAFGTGVIKLTPAHDRTDYEIGLRHHLKPINIFDDSARLNENAGPFAGMERYAARRALLEALAGRGLLISRKPHPISLPVCSRTGDVIEPMIREQWFLKCRKLGQKVLEAVRTGKTRVLPVQEQDRLEEWLMNLRDWCLSRQVWWGHPVPAFHCRIVSPPTSSTDNPKAHVRWIAAGTSAEARRKAADWFACPEHLVSISPDPDVLDTWFSSSLLPLALARCEKRAQPYPLSVMETGRDILVFWVARMMMMSAALGKKEQKVEMPFSTVVLHGLIVDAEGKKMSKSKGNAVDPLDVIKGATLEELHADLQQSCDEGVLSPTELETAKRLQSLAFPNGIHACGADALRMALLYADMKTDFVKVDLDKARSMNAFANKIWQATRFVTGSLKEIGAPSNGEGAEKRKKRAIEKWIMSRLSMAVSRCGNGLRNYDLHLAVEALYDFWYRSFCDVYLEACKNVLKGPDCEERRAVTAVLDLCLDVGWRLLFPFMPHLSEELYQRYHQILGTTAPYPSISCAPYPDNEQWVLYRDVEVESGFENAYRIVEAVRRVRDGYRFGKNKPAVIVRWPNREGEKVEEFAETVMDLARIKSLEFTLKEEDRPPGYLKVALGEDASVFVQIQGVVDEEDLSKRYEFLSRRIDELKKKMASKKFQREIESRKHQAHSKLEAFLAEKDQLAVVLRREDAREKLKT